MNIPDRFITLAELQRNDGENIPRRYIAHEGIVYDVTDCPRWQLEMHERLHFPGQDLSGEIAEAPHGVEVFTRPCVKVVGHLEEN